MDTIHIHRRVGKENVRPIKLKQTVKWERFFICKETVAQDVDEKLKIFETNCPLIQCARVEKKSMESSRPFSSIRGLVKEEGLDGRATAEKKKSLGERLR